MNTRHRVWVLGFPEKPPDWPAGAPFEPCSPDVLPPGLVVVHYLAAGRFIQLVQAVASSTVYVDPFDYAVHPGT